MVVAAFWAVVLNLSVTTPLESRIRYPAFQILMLHFIRVAKLKL